MELKDKVAIITGSTQAIGRGLAIRFAAEGASVAVVGRNKENGKKIVQEIRNAGNKAFFVQTDISKEKDVKDMVNRTLEEYGKIDILVNNAAAGYNEGPFYKLSLKDWKLRIDVNLTGTFLCSREVAGQMMKQKSGKILVVNSIYGLSISPGMCAYASSKGGLVQLTKGMALELAKYNISVNGIALGAISTEITEAFDHAIDHPLMQHIMYKRQGTIDEVVEVMLFMVSDRLNYMTGETILLDGGALAHFPHDLEVL